MKNGLTSSASKLRAAMLLAVSLSISWQAIARIKNRASPCLQSDLPVRAEEIIARCAAALGGMEKIAALKSLRISAVYPDHGELPLIFEIRRPNLCRNPKVNLVFDGKRACFLNGRDGKSQPELVNPEEWKDYEAEIAFNFPAFFDYPAVFARQEQIDDRLILELEVTLPLGAVMTYFIDSKSFLIERVSARFDLEGKEYYFFRDLFDYRPVKGLLFPFGFSYESSSGQRKGWVKSIETNFDFPGEWVRIPPELK